MLVKPVQAASLFGAGQAAHAKNAAAGEQLAGGNGSCRGNVHWGMHTRTGDVSNRVDKLFSRKVDTNRAIRTERWAGGVIQFYLWPVAQVHGRPMAASPCMFSGWRPL